MKIEMAAFDVAGTTVRDDGIVLKAFTNAFERTRPQDWSANKTKWTQYAIQTMGRSKIEVFSEILGNREVALIANRAFEAAYVESVESEGIAEITGSEKLFALLRDRGIKVALTTGFSRSTLEVIIYKMGWKSKVDLTVTAEDAGRGRPHPDMLEYAARTFGVLDRGATLIVGDTPADMQAATTFGSLLRVGVLTGTSSSVELVKSGATSVVNSVAEVSSLL